MKLKNYCIASLFIGTLLCANASTATIIDGYFKGVIYLDESDPAIWNSAPSAHTITGQFSYDTLLAPDARDGYPGSYTSTNHWLDLFVDIGGRRIDGLIESRNDIPIQRYEGVEISDYLGGTFSVGVFSFNEDDWDNYVDSYIGITIVGIPELLHSGSLIQNFSWKRKDTYPATAVLHELGERNGVQYSTHQEIYINKLTLKSRNSASVPESSAFIMLLTGLIGLFANYRRFRT